MTPSGPKNSWRTLDASQRSLSFTSWYAITVGMALLLSCEDGAVNV